MTTNTKPMLALTRRCKPHSIIAAAIETMRDEMRRVARHEAPNDPKRLTARVAVGRALAQALSAVPQDTADAMLKALLALQFMRPWCPEAHRPALDTWIAEIGAIGARLKPTPIRIPEWMPSVVEELGDNVPGFMAAGDRRRDED